MGYPKLLNLLIVLAILAFPSQAQLPAPGGVRIHLEFPDPLTLQGNMLMPPNGSIPWSLGPGYPVLPAFSYNVLLPPGSKAVKSIDYSILKVKEFRNFVLPRMGAVSPCIGGEAEVPGVHLHGNYPEEVLEYRQVEFLRGFPILPLLVIPFSYDPNLGVLRFFKEIEVSIQVDLGPLSSMYRGYPGDFDYLSKVVFNKELLSEYPMESRLNSYDLLIITDSSLLGPFQNFSEYKSRLGISTKVVTVEWIQENYEGADLQEKIRNFIKYAYENWGISYVLLAGDDDLIPHRGFYVSTGSSYYDYDIPADLYYAALDGTWDDDHDGRWGEVGEIDPYAEVFVGRAPVDTLQEAWTFVNKTISYEELDAGSGYLNKTLMVGEKLDDHPTWGGDYKDEVAEYVPSNWSVERLYDRDWPTHRWPKQEIVSKLEEGVHLVNHVGHGSVSYMARMFRSDVMGLRNEALFILYTQACYVASFDNRNPDGSYDPDDSIGEKFVLNPNGGAVAFIGNSRYGWYVSGSTNGPSQYFDIAFFQQLFQENERVLGRAHELAKEELASTIDDNAYMRWCYYELNLLGDPTLMIGGYGRLISILSPSDGEHLSGTINVTGTARSPSLGVADSVYLRIDDGDWSYVGSGGLWSAEVDTTRYPDGNHTIWAKAVYGSMQFVTNVSVVFDNSPPVIDRFCIWGGRYHNDTDITFTVLAHDNFSALTKMRFRFDGDVMTDWMSYDSNVTVEVPGEEGEHNVSAEVADEAGNVQSSVNISLTLDFSPPSVRILSPPDGGEVHSENVTVIWSMEDNLSPIANVSMSLDGGPWIPVALNSSYVLPIGPDGEHTVRVLVYDAAGNHASDQAAFLKDAHPPRIRIIQPGEGGFVGPNNMSLRWASNDEDIASYYVKVDDGPWIDLGLNTIYDLGGLPEGLHSASVKGVDRGGKEGAVVVDFTVDESPPEISIVSPQEGEVVDSLPIELSWMGSDNYSAIDHFELSLDGGAWEDVGKNTTLLLEDLEEGHHVLEVRAFDLVGLSSSDSTDFYLDLTPPEIVSVFPEDGAVFNSSAIQFLVNVTDNATPVRIYYSVDGGREMEYQGPTTLYLEEGHHTIEVTAVDEANHSSTVQVSFIVDLTPPLVAIQEPADGTVTRNSTVYVRWVAQDELSGISRVRVLVDGSEVPCSGQPCPLTLGEGDHVIEVVAFDLAGNSASDSVRIGVDTRPPILRVLGPENNSYIPTKEVDFEVHVEDDHEVSVEYFIDDAGPYVLEGTHINLTLDEGSHLLVVQATDSAGNSNETSRVFHIDLTPPVVEVESPANGTYSSDRFVSLRINATDNFGIANLTYSLDGSHFHVYIGSISLGPLGDGRHEIDVIAVDLSGHLTEVESSFVVDTVKPQVLLSYPSPGSILPSTFRVVFTIFDRNPESVSIYIDGLLLFDESGLRNKTFSGDVKITVGSGYHNIVVEAIDRAGNKNSSRVSVLVDADPPELAVSYPRNGSVIPTAFVSVNISCRDEISGLSYIEYSVDGGGFERVGLSTSINLGKLDDGEHIVVIRAYDNVGNEASLSVRFVVDTRPPSLEVSNFHGKVRMGERLVIDFNVSDITPCRAYFRIDGGSWVAVKGRQVTVETQNLGKGLHTLEIMAIDSAGHKSIKELSFEVVGSYTPLVILSMLTVVALAFLIFWRIRGSS